MNIRSKILGGALAAVLLIVSGCQQTVSEFTVTLGGDIILSRSGTPVFMHHDKEVNPWLALIQQGILGKDNALAPNFFMANLESPLGEGSSMTGDMNLCSHPSEVRVLKQAQLDLVTLANNHRDDCCPEGAQQTRQYLEKYGILAAGEDLQPVFLVTPQGRMAVIAVEDVTGSMDEAALVKSISAARIKARLIIVSVHWGNEFQAGPDLRQQYLAQELANAGADIIWGHHPHVLQKMEWLSAADGRDVLVLNSLGNLLADQWMLEDAQRSALVRLTLSDFKIIAIAIIPVGLDRESGMLQILSDPMDVVSRLEVSGLSDVEVRITEKSILK